MPSVIYMVVVILSKDYYYIKSRSKIEHYLLFGDYIDRGKDSQRVIDFILDPEKGLYHPQ